MGVDLERLRSAFVVTLGAIAAASCSTPRARKASPPAASGKSVSNLDYAKLTPLNPRDGDNRVIYASGEKCLVHLPRDNSQKSWQPPKTKQIDCPPSMDSGAWDQCHSGLIHRANDLGICICTRDGNPPPPPREVSCP